MDLLELLGTDLVAHRLHWDSGASSERLRRSIPPHFSARASEQHIDAAAAASGRGR
jgi:hypothetical protein